MLSTGLWRWYINITITILDIIHRPVFYLKYDISETGICLRLQVEPTQLGPIDGASFCVPPEDGDRIQSPKRHVFNKRQNDGWCPELW
jgi:hypothetical protein